MANKLALGTVQFGLDYGVANQQGRITAVTGAGILAEAARAGIDTLDTAIAYGDSEATLGAIGVDGFKVVSKLPSMPDETDDVSGWVANEVDASLARLGLAQLDGLLLHVPAQLLGPDGPALAGALQSVKSRGLVRKIGVSIYDPAELGLLCDACDLDLVQSPLNILDQRLLTSGWLARLAQVGTEVHVRSIFLQGLLLMSAAQRPARFQQWAALWSRWDDWLCAHRLSALETCLRFALQQRDVGRIVVGVDSLEQLRQVAGLSQEPLPKMPDFAALCDERLITPSCWNTL